MAASHSPGEDPGTDEASNENGDPDAYDAEEAAAALKAAMTAEELRRFAAHSGASRSRGATKSETAIQVAEGDPGLAAEAADGGGCEVSCSCGLRFRVGHPQTARAEAKAHKSANPTHWPEAVDEENGGARLYG